MFNHSTMPCKKDEDANTEVFFDNIESVFKVKECYDSKSLLASGEEDSDIKLANTTMESWYKSVVQMVQIESAESSKSNRRKQNLKMDMKTDFHSNDPSEYEKVFEIKPENVKHQIMNTVTISIRAKETRVTNTGKIRVIPEKKLKSKRSNLRKSKRPGKSQSRNEIKCSYKVRDKGNTLSICVLFYFTHTNTIHIKSSHHFRAAISRRSGWTTTRTSTCPSTPASTSSGVRRRVAPTATPGGTGSRGTGGPRVADTAPK